MKKLVATCIIGCSIGFFSGQVGAASVSLDPASQSIAPSGVATVDLNISDLGNFAAPSLGAFLVEVTFDERVLSFNSVTYGAFLGDPADAVETDIVTTEGVGSVSLDEFSFLFDSELDALQPASFTLATLSFRGENPGTSELAFGLIDLTDAVGSTIVDVTLDPASVVVTPLPAAVMLFVSGLGVLVACSRRGPASRMSRPTPRCWRAPHSVKMESVRYLRNRRT